MARFPRAQDVVARFVGERVAPGAVVEVGTTGGPEWRFATGRLTYADTAPPASATTIFDLASLTKVLATTTVAMRLVDDGRLRLDASVADLVSAWRGDDRRGVTVSDLLAHASGLPAHRPYHEVLAGRDTFERAIATEPLVYPPRSTSVYSDLGFMLLGFILEDVGGEPLDAAVSAAFEAIGEPVEVRFGLPPAWQARVAPTSDAAAADAVVDDRNARALGGVAGHAGLFGTAGGVGAVARAVLGARLSAGAGHPLASPGTVRRFTSRVGSASSRALGWDTMLPTSSCGTQMSPEAFGHTGFTGTSLWIEPRAGIYVALLTNRVYPAPGTSDGITAFRRAVHDAVMTDWKMKA